MILHFSGTKPLGFLEENFQFRNRRANWQSQKRHLNKQHLNKMHLNNTKLQRKEQDHHLLSGYHKSSQSPSRPVKSEWLLADPVSNHVANCSFQSVDVVYYNTVVSIVKDPRNDRQISFMPSFDNCQSGPSSFVIGVNRCAIESPNHTCDSLDHCASRQRQPAYPALGSVKDVQKLRNTFGRRSCLSGRRTLWIYRPFVLPFCLVCRKKKPFSFRDW